MATVSSGGEDPVPDFLVQHHAGARVHQVSEKIQTNELI